jgi:hypothetical protein
MRTGISDEAVLPADLPLWSKAPAAIAASPFVDRRYGARRHRTMLRFTGAPSSSDASSVSRVAGGATGVAELRALVDAREEGCDGKHQRDRPERGPRRPSVCADLGLSGSHGSSMARRVQKRVHGLRPL